MNSIKYQQNLCLAQQLSEKVLVILKTRLTQTGSDHTPLPIQNLVHVHLGLDVGSTGADNVTTRTLVLLCLAQRIKCYLRKELSELFIYLPVLTRAELCRFRTRMRTLRQFYFLAQFSFITILFSEKVEGCWSKAFTKLKLHNTMLSVHVHRTQPVAVPSFAVRGLTFLSSFFVMK